MLDAARLAELLSERFGVALTGEARDDNAGQRALFRPRDLSPTRGFSVDVLIGWRTVDASFVPGSFAGALLKAMGASTPDQRAIFDTFVRGAVSDGATVRFRINDRDVDPLDASAWPSEWSSIQFSLQKGPFLINGANPSAMQSLALTWSGRMLGSVLALMPLEPLDPPAAGEAEGGAREVVVKKYERSAINRAACIEIYGARCLVCGFDFEVTYGSLGAGFIEVHHRELVSALTPGTVLNPATDLAPVCSNCHSMLHRRRPPYTIDELKAVVVSARHRDAGASEPEPS